MFCGIRENKDSTRLVMGNWLFNYMCVFVHHNPCAPLCECVCLVNGGCLLAGNSNSCYWDFLYQHVNKRKPLEPTSVCPLANESWATSWVQPIATKKGCDSAP